MSILDYLKENLYLREKKDHLIKRISNLSDQEKLDIIDLFNKNPHLESKIDWNKINTLTFDDFKPLFDVRSKTGLIKNVKQKGISGLIEGKDYFNFPISKGEAYIPLNYEASKLIASNRIGSCEGKWCTAYQKTDGHWKEYVNRYKIVLIYIILNDTKYAVAVYSDNKNIEIFDAEDETLNDIDGINIRKKIGDNLNIINNARKYIQDNLNIYEKLGLSNYKVNSDGTVDVNANVDVNQSFVKDGKLIIKFNKVSGNFDCSNNELTTLEGAPEIVNGDFNCQLNQLISLKGAPQIVRGYIRCAYNQLTTLEGSPREVGGIFDCENNQLTTLKGAPEVVRASFFCSNNKLTTLEGAPEVVFSFDCSNNQLTTLEGAPKEVDGHFYCFGNNTKFIEEDVRKVSNVTGTIEV